MIDILVIILALFSYCIIDITILLLCCLMMSFFTKNQKIETQEQISEYCPYDWYIKHKIKQQNITPNEIKYDI